MFADRRDAGRKLAAALQDYAGKNPVVLALPRGGVPVAFEIAQALGAPLDLIMVRKIGAPFNPEYGLGAVVDGAEPQVVLNEDVMRMLAPGDEYVAQETQRQLAEIERRRAAYLGDRAPIPLRGRTIIIVDDGVATGGTARAALRGARKAGAAKIVLAVPVAPKEVIEDLRADADDIVCLSAEENFQAVGFHYADFSQTSDEEVVSLLAAARA